MCSESVMLEVSKNILDLPEAYLTDGDGLNRLARIPASLVWEMRALGEKSTLKYITRSSVAIKKRVDEYEF